MSSKSIKLWWSDRLMSSGNILGFLYGERKDTVAAANLMVTRMKTSPNLSMTKREMRFFAKDLETGKAGVKYSYHNFYTKLLRKLLDMGFVEKDVLVWDARRKKTASVYQLKIQPASERAPQGGFVKHAWHIAKGWNDLIQG
ncbi:MAG: hypothetical protein HY296_00535 [Thaumarchaeota archaeon]|nr:hypothetical protein [Nitrososphaerota archaeon]